MKPLLAALNDLPEFRQLCAAVDNGACPAAVNGLSAVHRAHFAAGLRQALGRPVVLVCADEGECQRLERDLAALSGEGVRTLSAREFTFHNAAVASRQWEHRRLSVLRALAAGECPLLVCTVEALLQRTMPKSQLIHAAQTLRLGESHDLNELAGTLTAAGYTRCEQVEGVGQFALRGHDAHKHRQIVHRPGLAHVGGGQVDGDAAGGPLIVQVLDGAAHPLTALLHGGVRQTHQIELRQPARKVGFDLHDVPRQTGHTEACHFCIHGLFPTFLLFYQYTAQRALAQARNGKNQAKLNKIRLTGLQQVGIFRVS